MLNKKIFCCLFFLILIFFNVNVYANIPSNYPQTSFYFQSILTHSTDFKLKLKKIENEGTQDEKTTITELDSTTETNGGYGAGFNIEIPHKKWISFGFSLGYRLNKSSQDKFDVMMIGFRFNTLTRFYTRLQYTYSYSLLHLTPFLRFGLGVSSGFFTVSKYREDQVREDNQGIPLVLTSFPIESQFGLDVFVGSWFGISLAYYASLEYGIDFFTKNNPRFAKEVHDNPSIFAVETAFTLAFKTTYF